MSAKLDLSKENRGERGEKERERERERIGKRREKERINLGRKFDSFSRLGQGGSLIFVRDYSFIVIE